jgi:hypothetical protein
MYELKKKVGKLFTSKFVETGPSFYKKKNLPARGLTKVEKHWHRAHVSYRSTLCYSDGRRTNFQGVIQITVSVRQVGLMPLSVSQITGGKVEDKKSLKI